MNQFPVFISLDVVGDHQQIVPVTISWSMPDGQIKSTLIRPEEDWEVEEIALGDLDLDTIIEQGATPAEIVTEMNLDFEDTTVYCFDEYQDVPALDALFHALNDEPGFEVIPWLEAFDDSSNEAIFETANWVGEVNSLNLSTAEDRVKQMLLSFAELK
jgi:hypothetical protein